MTNTNNTEQTAQEIINDSEKFALSEAEQNEIKQIQTDHNISKCLKGMRK